MKALITQRGEGDDGAARLLLTKALKAAHAHLNNIQLVAQVRSGGGGGRCGTTLSCALDDDTAAPAPSTCDHAIPSLVAGILFLPLGRLPTS